MSFTIISRDPIARQNTIRRIVSGGECNFCGMLRARKNLKKKTLFQYGTETNYYVSFDNHKFCSRGCYNLYHA